LGCFQVFLFINDLFSVITKGKDVLHITYDSTSAIFLSKYVKLCEPGHKGENKSYRPL